MFAKLSFPLLLMLSSIEATEKEYLKRPKTTKSNQTARNLSVQPVYIKLKK